MKQTILALGALAAAAFSLSSCEKEINQSQTPVGESAISKIVASTEAADTKTSNDGSMHTAWAAGDAINVFPAGDMGSWRAFGEFTTTESGVTANFNGKIYGRWDNLPEDGGWSQWNDWESYSYVAVYPSAAGQQVPFESKNANAVRYIGSAIDGTQVQNGINDSRHIAGPAVPMYAFTKGVKRGVTPVLKFNHLTSTVKVVVSAPANQPLTVETISFEAPTDIIGAYFIDIEPNGSDVNTIQNIRYNKTTAEGEEEKVAQRATLTVNNGTIPAGGNGEFYLVVKPFIAEAGQNLVLTVNQESKEITVPEGAAIKFSAGKIKTLSFNINEFAEDLTVDATVEGNKVNLSWNAITGAEKYTVSYTDSKTITTLGPTTETQMVIPDLASGLYTFTVTASGTGYISISATSDRITVGDVVKPETLHYVLYDTDGSKIYTGEEFYPDFRDYGLQLDDTGNAILEDGKPVWSENPGRCAHVFQQNCEVRIETDGRYLTIAEAAELYGVSEDFLTPELNRNYISYLRDCTGWETFERENDEVQNSQADGPYIITEAVPVGWNVVLTDEPCNSVTGRHRNYLNRYVYLYSTWTINGTEVISVKDVYDVFWFMGRDFYNHNDNLYHPGN